MPIDREEIKAEQLSMLIDALNNKEQLVTNDAELQELADVASMVKQAAGQSKPTPETIDYIARELKAESKVKQSKPRFGWLYSGAAGLAAAVLLVAVTNFMPAVPDKTEQQLPPQVQISEVLPQTNTAPGSLGGTQTNISKKADIPNSAMQSQEIVSNRAAVRTEKQPNPQAAKQAPALAGQVAGVAAARSTDVKQARVLAIPGKDAKALSVDDDTGFIKQVYAFENDKEVTITQKAKGSGAPETDNAASVAVMKEEAAEDGKEMKASKESANKITAAKDEYEVTVEGELSKEELQEIADSLVETEETEESGKE